MSGKVIHLEIPDAALERIEKLGGTTAQAELPVGDLGWSAYFKDPEGNLLGLFQVAGS